MTSYVGAEHWVGFRPQAVTGVPETTVNTFLSTEGLQMYPNPKHVDRKAFNASAVDLAPRVGTISPDGKCPTEVMASQPHPWYWAAGNVATTLTAASAGASAWLHTSVVPKASGMPAASGEPILLTAEGDRVFGDCRQGDVKVSKLKLSCTPGEVARLEVEWLGISHTEGATLTSTPTFTTDVLTCRNVILKVDGTQDLTVTSMDMEYDTGMKAVAVLEDADGALHEVLRDKRQQVTGNLKWLDFPAAQLTKFIAATSFALIVEIDGDTIFGANVKYLKLTAPVCVYTGGLNPNITDGNIDGAASFRAYYDTSTTQMLKVQAQNTISSITS